MTPRRSAGLTFVALAVLLGGTFSFWDSRRTDDLPVSSSGENRKSQFSVLLSPVTFSSLKTCRLILGKQRVVSQEEGGDTLLSRRTYVKTSELTPRCRRVDVPFLHGRVCVCETPQAACPLPERVLIPFWGELPLPGERARRALSPQGKKEEQVLEITGTLWVKVGRQIRADL